MSAKTTLRRLLLIALTFVVCCAFAAQNATSPPSEAPTQITSQEQNKEQKKDKKTRNQDGTSGAVEFSDAVANNVMNDIRDGLEGHSSRLMLSAFDADRMNGYLSFADQIHAFFDQYDNFRVHIRVLQTSVEESRGIVLADFELEAIPRGGGPALRRNGQLRFELERGKKGRWKVVEFRPRGFFS